MNINFINKIFGDKLTYSPTKFGVQKGYMLCRIIYSTIVVVNLLFNCSKEAAASSSEGIQVYSNKHKYQKQQGVEDHIDKHNIAKYDLWKTISSNFSLQHFGNNPDVQKQIQLFAHDPYSLVKIASRSTPYLYFIYQQVKKRNLPAELVLIPVIESGYNPFNLSSSGAAGIWQIMPETATGLGVKQDWWYDGRRDIVASTKAALDYLEYLFDFFDGNYLLAIAAYNSGEGAVMSAMKRNIKLGKNTNFWLLPLSNETRIYVQRFLALATIIATPEKYKINLPPVSNTPYLAQVDVGGQIDLQTAAKFAHMSLKDLHHLNPGFTHLVTHPHGPYKLVLPIENVEHFITQLSNKYKSNQVNWIQYKVKKYDTIDKIAAKFNTTVQVIKKINHLDVGLIKPGNLLVIPNKANVKDVVDSLQQYKQNSRATDRIFSNMHPGDTLYIFRDNDSIPSIAKKFHLSPNIIYKANNLTVDSSLTAGFKLLLPTHLLQGVERKNNISRISAKIISPGNTLYMIRKVDTLDKLAKKFHTSASTLRLYNLITNNRLIAGEYIIIPTSNM